MRLSVSLPILSSEGALDKLMDAGRRQWLAMALGAASAVSAPANAASSAEMHPVTVALTARHSLYHLPLVLAERLGYFRQQSLMVQLVSYESGAAGVASVLAGKSDVLASAFEHLFELQRKGHFFQAFVQMNATPMVSLGIASGRNPQRSWQDLKSARIGVSALETGTHWMTSLWLLRQGLQPQDVQFVEVGTSASALGALWEGQIDALCNPDPVMHLLELRGDIRLIAEARTQAGVQQAVGGPLPGGCLIAREEFLQKNPQVATALAKGVVQALRWLQTAGPTDLFKNVPVAPWIADRTVYLGALEKVRDAYARNGQIQEEAVINAWRVHARVASQMPGNRNMLSRTFTNAFVGRAKS